MDRHAQQRVVIVGGGFGGLFAVRALHRGPFAITLIDQSEHHLFAPLLYQCATGILSEGQITAPLRRLLRHERDVECEMAMAVDVDAARQVVICRRPLGAQFEVAYDHLIVAAGVEQSYFGHDDFRVLAPGMKTIADALTIRRRVYGAFEMAETASDPAEQATWLTFALVGAGPTGVELAGQIRELATKTLREEYQHAHPEDCRVLLFDGGDAPLAAFGDRLAARTASTLRKLGVELHMGSIVTDVFAGGLRVRDHQGQETTFEAATVLWTAGVAAPPFAAALAKATGAEQDKAGRIRVQDDLTIAGHPEISVVGDMMSLGNLPGVAEVAMQAGHYAGKRIRRAAVGRREASPFKYRDLGSAAYIARGKAVVSAGPLHLSGFLGWVFWLFIHIAFLTGFRNRAGALLTWWVAFTRDVRRERAFTAREVGRIPNVYTLADAPVRPDAPARPDPAAVQHTPTRPDTPAPRDAPALPDTAAPPPRSPTDGSARSRTEPP